MKVSEKKFIAEFNGQTWHTQKQEVEVDTVSEFSAVLVQENSQDIQKNHLGSCFSNSLPLTKYLADCMLYFFILIISN